MASDNLTEPRYVICRNRDVQKYLVFDTETGWLKCWFDTREEAEQCVAECEAGTDRPPDVELN